MPLPAPAAWSFRCRHLLLNGLAFGLCYPLANLLAQRLGVTRGVALPLDAAIPFLPWMILPYSCSGLFFCASFLLVRSRAEVALLSRRLLLATLAGGLVFFLYPLHFQLPRPPVQAPWLDRMFQVLALVDRPYNQFPSLHVAYCMLFWSALQARAAQAHVLLRVALAATLLLVALSTVFTYQHHLLDVAGGLLLGGLTLALLRKSSDEVKPVAFYYSMAALLVFQLGVLAQRETPAASLVALYLAASLLLVSLAYARGDRRFLGKHQGRHPAWSWLLYAPYLGGYWLTWQLVRLRGRGQPPCRQLAQRLWVGRRLSASEAAQLPPGCVVIDLANELAETAALRRPPYHHYALLDLAAPEPGVIADIVAVVTAAIARGDTVYLHCAMGYSRSRFIYQRYTEKIAA